MAAAPVAVEASKGDGNQEMDTWLVVMLGFGERKRLQVGMVRDQVL